jgi:tetratricopeptide (TPR) repeat protein
MNVAVASADVDVRADALALIQQADHLAKHGRLKEAGEQATRALALARQCGDRHITGWASWVIGFVMYDAGNYLSAYASATEAYRLLEACGDVSRQLSALVVCANVYMYSDDNASRVELLRKGLPLAVGPDHASVRCKLLRNLADGLCDNNEHAEAIECLNEALALALHSPQRSQLSLSLASQLANVHLKRADHLHRLGQAERARAQLAAAARTLPPLGAESWRSMSIQTCYGMWSQVAVLASVGQVAAARHAAASCIKFTRQSKGNLINVGQSLTALASLYRRQGQWQPAIRCELRLLRIWRAANYESEIIISLRRLSELHARVGAHDRALAVRKELATHQSRQRQESGALRCRLAAIERQAERRRLQAREALAHAQRLAIIGRLIAETHHALATPIASARLLSTRALACAADPDALRPMLAELSQLIDRATALISQLKLFSYRSALQPMVLSLHEALLDAWRGLDAHLGSRVADLRVSGQTQLQVWCDAQRLGIMLKVLLIELTQQADAGAALVVIGAQMAAGDADTVLLHIQALGKPASSAGGQAAAASLGAALCMEIAAEMQGELRSADDDGAVRRYRLQLPDAAAALPMPAGTLDKAR